jgi:16S rRNA (adenine1518-N6/adenine1519-N6)-dimethyltransferase
MRTLNEIKQVLDQYNLSPNKKFGQVFLCDKNIIQKILAKINSDDIIFEIGPGLGAVTLESVKLADKVYAIDIDRGFIRFLEAQKQQDDIKNLFLIHNDVLTYDFENEFKNKKIVVVGNLPYYITGPILIKLIKAKNIVKKAVIMIQEEAAIRLLGGPGNKNYGKLTVYYNMFTDIKMVCKVSKNSFFPKPKVDSIILEIDYYKKPKVKLKNEELFYVIVKTAFGKRRKIISNSLKDLDLGAEKLDEVLLKANIKENARAEELSYIDYANIANNI